MGRNEEQERDLLVAAGRALEDLAEKIVDLRVRVCKLEAGEPLSETLDSMFERIERLEVVHKGGAVPTPGVMHVVPWSAAGPGWADAGLSVRLLDGTQETIYADPREMGIETLALFPHFLHLYNAVLKEVTAGRHKVKKSARPRRAQP